MTTFMLFSSARTKGGQLTGSIRPAVSVVFFLELRNAIMALNAFVYLTASFLKYDLTSQHS
jgi:hypothetical protein